MRRMPFVRFLGCAFAASVVCVVAAHAAPASVLDGTFEKGTDMPIGWTLGGGARWAGSGGRHGGRCIEASTPALRAVATSDSFPCDSSQSYRFSGWVKKVRGRARLSLEFLDADGKVVDTADAESASAEGDWQYAAVESDVPAGAVRVRARFLVRGKASLDDVNLVPLVENLLFNPSCDGDRKGRVSFWGEDPLWGQSGPRGGSMRADPAGGRGGGSAMRIEADTSWFAAHNITMEIPPGPSVFRLSAWAKSERGDVTLAVEWLDWAGTVHRADTARAVESVNGWTRYEVETPPPPDSAEAYNVAAIASHGAAWFDDFDFRPVNPATNRRRQIRVLVNQVGYETTMPKSAVVATTFVPMPGDPLTLDVVDSSGRVVRTVPLTAEGRIHEGTPDDWGWYFWRAEFDDFRDDGHFRAIAHVGNAVAESPPFCIGRNALFDATANLSVDFFFVQRCGYAVPGWHAACHLDDAKLPDGSHIDATGGWHSAGDYNKLMYENGDGGVAYALLDAERADPTIMARYDRDRDGVPDAVDEAKWGLDFVAKMQIPDTGGLRNDVKQGPGRTWMKWTAPEDRTDNIVGTADDPVIEPGEGSSPLAIGGWVRLAALVPDTSLAASYRDHAVRLWNHATNGGTAGESAYLLLSTLDLADATHDPGYESYARACVRSILASQQAEGRRAGAYGAYGGYGAGALAVFAIRRSQDALVPGIKASLDRWMTFAASTTDNAFGLAKQSVGDEDYFFEPTSAYGHNFEVLARAWAALEIYRLTGDVRASRYAMDQIDWVFGRNPYALCMFEGVGTLDPPRLHTRYDAIPGHEDGIIPGAIPNGFVRSPRGFDKPGFDMTRGRKEREHPSYRTSEPWLVHNMWHLMAISALAQVVASH